MSEESSNSRVEYIVVTAIVAVLGAAGAWFLLGSGPADSELDVAPPAAVITPTAATPENSFSVEANETESAETLLNKARMAVSADMIAEPPGQNALYFYSLALEAYPDNTEAKSEFATIETQVASNLTAAIETNTYTDDVAKLAERLDIANPTSSVVAQFYDGLESRRSTLESDIVAAAQAGNDTRAETLLAEVRDLPGATTARMRDLTDRVAAATSAAEESRRQAQAERERLAAERRQQEAERTAASAAEQPAESPGETEESQPRVAAATIVEEPTIEDTVGDVSQLLDSGALTGEDGAAQAITALVAENPDNADVSALTSRWRAAAETRIRRDMAFEQVADARSLIVALADWPGGADSAAVLGDELELLEATIEARDTVIPASQMAVVDVVSPLYPRAAKRKDLEGWVEIEFTVAPDGSTEDIEVVRASTENIFDKATIQAVSQWQFVPKEYKGTPIPQRVSTRVSFRLTS